VIRTGSRFPKEKVATVVNSRKVEKFLVVVNFYLLTASAVTFFIIFIIKNINVDFCQRFRIISAFIKEVYFNLYYCFY
jgi:hypothetical protein